MQKNSAIKINSMVIWVTMNSQTIEHAVVDHLLLVCAGDNAPTDEEFSNMVKTISSLSARVTGILVLAGTKRPTSSQRSEMVSVLRGRKLRIAMVSDSRVARGALTAIGWFVSGVKAYKAEEVERALAYLEVDKADVERFLLKLRSLQSVMALAQEG